MRRRAPGAQATDPHEATTPQARQTLRRIPNPMTRLILRIVRWWCARKGYRVEPEIDWQRMERHERAYDELEGRLVASNNANTQLRGKMQEMHSGFDRAVRVHAKRLVEKVKP